MLTSLTRVQKKGGGENCVWDVKEGGCPFLRPRLLCYGGLQLPTLCQEVCLNPHWSLDAADWC